MKLDIEKRNRKLVTLSMRDKDIEDLKKIAGHYKTDKSKLVRALIRREEAELKKTGNNK